MRRWLPDVCVQFERAVVSRCGVGRGTRPLSLFWGLIQEHRYRGPKEYFGYQGGPQKSNSSRGLTWGGEWQEREGVLRGQRTCHSPTSPSPQSSPYLLYNCLYVHSTLLLQLFLCSIFLFRMHTLRSKSGACCIVGWWGCF